MTGSLRAAAREQLVQYDLVRGCVALEDGHVEQRAAVEDRRPHRLWMTQQVVLHHRGPVGAAVQIDLRVPERAAHVVQVVDGDRGREEARVDACRAEARDPVRTDLVRAPRPGDETRGRAEQWLRLPRGAL